MGEGLDLNQLRDTLLAAQQRREEYPRDPDQRVFVDRQGNILLGSDVAPQETQRLSQVHQGTFSFNRAAHEAAVVAQKLPPGTFHATWEGKTGWCYALNSAFGQPYTLFLFFDGSLYQTKLVTPALAGRFPTHDCHLYANGRLCLGTGDGRPSLEDAYAKSVLWCTGMDVYRLTGRFPFSRTNL